MNEFTKEELRDILNWASVYIQGSEMSYRVHKPLIEKIKSMIDSYKEDACNRTKKVNSHLKDAVLLISHAMSLLEDNDE